jgi:hypothetical protein
LIVSVCFIALSGILPALWRYDSFGSLFGFIVALVLTLSLLTPLSVYFDKLLSQIHINFHPLKKETPTPTGNRARKKGRRAGRSDLHRHQRLMDFLEQTLPITAFRKRSTKRGFYRPLFLRFP